MVDLTKLIAGNRVGIYYGKKNINNKTFHIRGIVDFDQVVVRKWDRYKREWVYGVKDMSFFEFMNERGFLSHIGLSTGRNK